MFRKALIPLDGSSQANAILPYVSQLARGLDMPLVLLAVMYRSVTDAGSHYFADLLGVMERHAETRLQEIVAWLAEEGVRAEGRVQSGEPVAEILGAAQSLGYDLVSMSTHGRNFVARGILGSVTDQVLHMAQIPVLTVTPETASRYG